jgi:Protein of unknown function (DUF4446)
MAELEDFFSANALYLWGVLAAAVILVGLWILAVQLRLSQVIQSHNQLVGGVDEGNLEDALGRQVAFIVEAKEKVETLQGDLTHTTEALKFAIQRVGLVRFNPFDDTGGDQSFALALLDARGDGLVLSSLFARRETRIFAKPIRAGKSTHVLTAEEQQAIELANAAPAALPESVERRTARPGPADAESAD